MELDLRRLHNEKKIFVRGPVLSQSGYGEQSRFTLRALKSREDLFDGLFNLLHGERPDGSQEDNGNEKMDR